MQEGEIDMFCLPARGAREEEERKRRERGCEDRWVDFSLSVRTCQPLNSFRWTSALLDASCQVSDVTDKTGGVSRRTSADLKTTEEISERWRSDSMDS